MLIGCTLGDPAGIGPDVLLQAARQQPEPAVLLIGDLGTVQQRARLLELAVEPTEVSSPAQARAAAESGAAGPWVLSCAPVKAGLRPGHPRGEDGLSALEAIRRGVELATAREIDALVTGPVNKHLVALHEPGFHGHTDLLATLAGVSHPIMLFAAPRDEETGGTRRPPGAARPLPAADIALLSAHLPLASALTLIRRDTVTDMLCRLDRAWSRQFGRAPCIGLAALNPHAGESGRIGTEEWRHLAPAVTAARAAGLDVRGPFPADSIFLRPGLDVILALYHDQGTIMAKRAPWPTINVTLGLPYVRTSPDHGTAYDLAGSGTADWRPMAAAIRLAGWLARRS